MPKVSFYLRNEDVNKWKAIQKKTGWVHAKLNDKTIYMNGKDPMMVMEPDLMDEPTIVIPEDATWQDVKVKSCKHGYSINARLCKMGCK